MNQQPSLVIMAAGIGSRFGGLKQLAPIGINGEPILKFSLYDAIEAGFKKVVFIIKEEIDSDFRRLIGNGIEKQVDVEYVYQRLDMLPPGYTVPPERIKPWGTAHAVLCAKDVLSGPFAVINADDYYGKDAFHVMCNHLRSQRDNDIFRFSMVGYLVENTLTKHGHVARGVCRTNNGYLSGIDERLRIEKHGDIIEYTEDNGDTWNIIEPGTIVSMNLWGFSKAMMDVLDTEFAAFLDYALANDPIKGEYQLPKVVNKLLGENLAEVRVLRTDDKWYGVTYKEDLAAVASAIQEMQSKGLYRNMYSLI